MDKTKNMKKIIFGLMVLAAFTFTSCESLDLFDKNFDKEGYCDFVYPLT